MANMKKGSSRLSARFAAISVVAVSVIALVATTYLTESGVDAAIPANTLPSPNIDTERISAASSTTPMGGVPTRSPDAPNSTAPVTDRNVIRRARYLEYQEGDTTLKLLEKPQNYVDRAKSGDAPSALALLKALNACFPVSYENRINPVQRSDEMPASIWPECANLDPMLARDRLSILVPSIQAGSAEAKLAFAANVEQVFFNDKHAGDMQRLYSSDQVQRIAERYAVEAAQAGIREAYLLLANFYMTGRFGRRDLVSGFAYASALNSLKADAAANELILRYKPQLTPRELQEAAEMASSIVRKCCARGG